MTSKQEKYVVLYTRNDTGKVDQKQTTERGFSIDDLYPGAGYTIQVFAVSHGLQSEPHNSFQAVPPEPPLDVVVTQVSGTNVSLAWTPPDDSLYTEFVIRYRPVTSEQPWSEVSVAGDETDVTLEDMSPGQQFTIQLDSVSYNVASGQPVVTFTTTDPSPVTFDTIEPILDAENITLQWPVPPGRVEMYHLSWFPVAEPNQILYKLINGEDVERTGADSVKVLVDNLTPGVQYQLEVTTESHERKSRSVRTLVRTQPLVTSDLSIITHPEVGTALTLLYTPTPLTKSTFDTYR